ncbi:hypothetical protein [Flavobacterium sp.]|uniref:hypothetical protein n=1 Tax=Flavobacterium sp. TaxID=239 RepID=UPI0025BE1008|nr:hypothetical protein [Flavobacterium sp.]
MTTAAIFELSCALAMEESAGFTGDWINGGIFALFFPSSWQEDFEAPTVSKIADKTIWNKFARNAINATFVKIMAEFEAPNLHIIFRQK